MGKNARENLIREKRSRRNRWLFWGATVLVLGGLVFLLVKAGSQTNTNQPPSSSGLAPAITSTDWTQGKKDAKVTVIEYGDFQCPACGAYYPVYKQLITAYGDKVLFVFRNYPLYQVHADAGIAAQAAEAAGLQEKYWEMHDLLFENQKLWSLASPNDAVKNYFDVYATTLGLDVNRFNQDINSSAVKNKIQNDATGGNAAFIDHTPTFFVNLKQIPNPTSYDQFKSVLDNALAGNS